MNSPPSKKLIAAFIIKGLPDLVQQGLLDDPSIVGPLNLQVFSNLTISGRFEFNEGDFVIAARKTFETGGPIEIECSDGKLAKLEINAGELTLLVDKETIPLLDLALTSSEAKKRLEFLAKTTKAAWFSGQDRERLTGIVQHGPLDGDRLREFLVDIRDIPEDQLKLIRHSVRAGSLSVQDIAPSGSRYYSRLIGECPQAACNEEDIVSRLRQCRTERLSEDLRNGLGFAVVSAGRHDLIPLEDISAIDHTDLLEALQSLQFNADIFGLISALAISLGESNEDKQFLDLSKEFIQSLSEKAPQLENMCELFSGAFVVISAELSMNSETRNSPWLWRQLSAFAQASLFCRCVDIDQIDSSHFFEWSIRSKGLAYQVAAAMSGTESLRWRSDWIYPTQLNAELIGRLQLIIEDQQELCSECGLDDVIKKLIEKFSEKNEPLAIFLPGPLEGGLLASEQRKDAPEEVLAMALESVNSPLRSGGCGGALNFALIYQPTPKMVDGVSQRISEASPRDFVSDKGEITHEVIALVHFSIVSGSEELANQIRDLLIRAVVEFDDVLASGTAIIIFNLANAVREFDSRQDFLGDALMRLALVVNDRSDAANLVSVIETACIIDPGLVNITSKAKAAAVAFARSL
jgi:hypothetical protein